MVLKVTDIAIKFLQFNLKPDPLVICMGTKMKEIEAWC